MTAKITTTRKPAARRANASEAKAPATVERTVAPVSTRPKDRDPSFPAIVIHFSKDNDTAFQCLKFDTGTDAAEYKRFLALTVGAIRVIKNVKDLADVPTPVLLAIFNRSRADKPLDRFRDRESAENRVFEVLETVATPSTESIMAEAEKTEAKTKADAVAAEKKATREKKEAEKKAKAAEKEKAKAERSAGGVIGTIKAAILSDKGATVDEIMKTLVEKFPDRGADGMKSTVKIQTSRLKAVVGPIANAEIEGRGRVYKAVSAGEIKGKRVEAAPVAAEGSEGKAGAVAKIKAADAAKAEPKAADAAKAEPKAAK